MQSRPLYGGNVAIKNTMSVENIYLHAELHMTVIAGDINTPINLKRVEQKRVVVESA